MALADHAVHRSGDGRVLQIQFGLCDRGLLLLHAGAGRARAGFGDRHLLRPGLRRADRGFRLDHMALRARDCRLRGVHGGVRACFRGHRGVVLLAGNFVLGDQLPHALQVLPRLGVIGLGLAQTRLGRIDFFLRRRQIRLGHRHRAGGAGARDGHGGAGSALAGHRVGQVSAGTV
jgi:hypothetical protein